MPEPMIATLLTDFGTRDAYVASMKGVILHICPGARVVDVSHDVPPQDVLAGAMVLAQAAPCFPEGTVHVGVVDPGVGTARAILAARAGGQRFIVPDNGLLSVVVERLPLEELVAVTDRRLLDHGGPSATFHGRDIFAPIAGHLLNGMPLRKLGHQPETYKHLQVPSPFERDEALVGQVVYVDGFGNLVTNVDLNRVMDMVPAPDHVVVECAGRRVGALKSTYAAVERGEAVALINSMGRVEVAVNGGRACDELGCGVGAEVCLRPG